LIVATCLGEGCGPAAGRDPGLKIGGRARLVSPAGTKVSLEFISPARPKAGRGKVSTAAAVKIETLAVPNGTEVSVLAVDGDDVRIRLEGKTRPGLIVWVESAKLEPVRP
jgi:hypothetical protein